LSRKKLKLLLSPLETTSWLWKPMCLQIKTSNDAHWSSVSRLLLQTLVYLFIKNAIT